ncbi:hypothetical protein ACFQ4K_17230 [Tistrella bauzanensis]
MPVFVIQTWRLVIASLLLAMLPQVRRALRGSGLRQLGRHALTGLLAIAGYLAGIVGAIAAGMPAGTVALIAALQPLVIAGLTAIRARHLPSPRLMIGLGLGMAGVAVTLGGDVVSAAGLSVVSRFWAVRWRSAACCRWWWRRSDPRAETACRPWRRWPCSRPRRPWPSRWWW